MSFVDFDYHAILLGKLWGRLRLGWLGEKTHSLGYRWGHAWSNAWYSSWNMRVEHNLRVHWVHAGEVLLRWQMKLLWVDSSYHAIVLHHWLSSLIDCRVRYGWFFFCCTMLSRFALYDWNLLFIFLLFLLFVLVCCRWFLLFFLDFVRSPLI